MRRSLMYCLALLAALSLGGCQMMRPDPAAGLTGMAAVKAHFQAGNLETATDMFCQLPRPQAGSEEGKVRKAMRQRLTKAWKRRGQQALKRRDLGGATAALSRIRSLHPEASVKLDALKEQGRKALKDRGKDKAD